jgi:2-desacetyl-2-hydroxyethyl bacteriochlorophyllide A dehydrogenase
MRFVKPVIDRVPDEFRPELRRAYRLVRDSWSAARSGRRLIGADRVVWLRPEVADLESFHLMAPGRGQILMRTESSLISPGTERAYLLGLPNTSSSFPSGAGYSAAGVVEDVGRGVSGWKVGDRVAGIAPHASRAVVGTDRVVAIPSRVSADQAAFVYMGVIALQAVRRAGIRAGDEVVVLGLGLVGQLIAGLARWAGGSSVVGVARTNTHAEKALVSGCDEALDLGSRGDEIDHLAADVVFEATGSPAALDTALRATRDGGTVVLAGSSRGVNAGVDLGEMVGRRGIRVIGAHVSSAAVSESAPGRWTRTDEASLFLDLVANGVVRVDHLIDRRVLPIDANRVYEELVSERSPMMALIFDWMSGADR